ncbi:MAG TPA: hypothetical protein VFX92_11045, partial [Candidatus Krumholzibacteria bacterium]|nr:hypothetical protein [Candidatus Krumholzibacteria bacterium]
ELTYVYEGSSCEGVGQWDDFVCAGGDFAWYGGGTVTIYMDATPDADFFNPATFRDGSVVLLAESQLISVLDNDPDGCPMLPNPPDVTAYFTFTGGAWYPRASNNGVAFQAVSQGELGHDVPAPLEALGYVFQVDGTVDIYGTVAVEETTWGRVKALYR